MDAAAGRGPAWRPRPAADRSHQRPAGRAVGSPAGRPPLVGGGGLPSRCGGVGSRLVPVDLWGAALVIHRMGPVDDFWCSEDTLFGFREWLVEQGRLVYEAAIADPDSLADNPEL